MQAKDCTGRCMSPAAVPMKPFMIRVFLSSLLVLCAVSCGKSDPSFVRLGDYECDAGEAVVRHLLQIVPDNITGGVPKEFSVVKALDLRSTDMDFARRFDDTKLTFVSRDVLSEQPDTHYPMNPKSGLSPILLQLRHVKKLNDQAYEIEAGWAYKRTFEMKRFHVQQTGATWKVEERARIDGNYEKPVQ